jgi:hypothetical protein
MSRSMAPDCSQWYTTKSAKSKASLRLAMCPALKSQNNKPFDLAKASWSQTTYVRFARAVLRNKKSSEGVRSATAVAVRVPVEAVE